MSAKDQAVSVKTKGNTAFQAGKFPEAIEFYSQAIKLDPTDHTFWTNRSASYAGLNQHEKALADANEAIKLNNKWMKGHYRRGAALLALEKFDDAYAAFKRAQELEPGNADIPKRLEEVSFERKRRTDEKLAKAAQGALKGFAAEKEAGNEFYKQGKYDQAVLCYTRALDCAKSDEERVTALSNRAAALAQQRFFDKVVKDCSEALSNDRDYRYAASVKALLRRGLAYEDGEKWEAARADLMKVVAMDPSARQASEALIRINRNLEAKKKWEAKGQ